MGEVFLVWLPISINSLIWLMLVVYALHGNEEIIMLMPWMRKNNPLMHKGNAWFAEKYKKVVAHYSTPCLAVMGLLYSLLIITPIFVTVEFKLYSIFIGILLAYAFHLLIHIVEFALIRTYIPMIVTALFSALYVIDAIWKISAAEPINRSTAWIAGAGASAFYLIYIYFANMASKFFESWLVKKFLR